ncbi:MAG: isochorismatase [Gammaproteobacteria bacterium]|jgi:nicotinamidase-related amidase|nr:isochorismatase [Gammaproteobacteria bacterium]
MLLDSEQSLLLLIDVQENTINFIHQHEQLKANCKDLLAMANKFNVPILASEHCPEKSDLTVASLRQCIEPSNCFNKVEFSCVASQEGRAKLAQYNRQQIVLAGVETHVCVLQTAIELLHLKKQVYVVADAVDSRFAEDKHLALQRMQALGIQLVSKQMVLFEWGRSSDNPSFQTLSEQMLK